MDCRKYISFILFYFLVFCGTNNRNHEKSMRGESSPEGVSNEDFIEDTSTRNNEESQDLDQKLLDEVEDLKETLVDEDSELPIDSKPEISSLSEKVHEVDSLNGGAIIGNGGDACVYYDHEGQIQNIEILDIYEARTRWGLELNMGEPSEPYEQKISRILERVKVYDIYRYHTYKAKFEKFHENAVFWPDANLPNIEDSNHITLDKKCDLRQIAIQNYKRVAGDKDFIISEYLWNKLDEINKAALVLHEIIYQEMVNKFGHQNSTHARYYNVLLMSDKLGGERKLKNFYVNDLLKAANMDYSIKGRVYDLKYFKIIFKNNEQLARISLKQNGLDQYGDAAQVLKVSLNNNISIFKKPTSYIKKISIKEGLIYYRNKLNPLTKREYINFADIASGQLEFKLGCGEEPYVYDINNDEKNAFDSSVRIYVGERENIYEMESKNGNVFNHNIMGCYGKNSKYPHNAIEFTKGHYNQYGELISAEYDKAKFNTITLQNKIISQNDDKGTMGFYRSGELKWTFLKGESVILKNNLGQDVKIPENSLRKVVFDKAGFVIENDNGFNRVKDYKGENNISDILPKVKDRIAIDGSKIDWTRIKEIFLYTCRLTLTESEYYGYINNSNCFRRLDTGNHIVVRVQTHFEGYWASIPIKKRFGEPNPQYIFENPKELSNDEVSMSFSEDFLGQDERIFSVEFYYDFFNTQGKKILRSTLNLRQAYWEEIDSKGLKFSINVTDDLQAYAQGHLTVRVQNKITRDMRRVEYEGFKWGDILVKTNGIEI